MWQPCELLYTCYLVTYLQCATAVQFSSVQFNLSAVNTALNSNSTNGRTCGCGVDDVAEQSVAEPIASEHHELVGGVRDQREHGGRRELVGDVRDQREHGGRRDGVDAADRPQRLPLLTTVTLLVPAAYRPTQPPVQWCRYRGFRRFNELGPSSSWGPRVGPQRT